MVERRLGAAIVRVECTIPRCRSGDGLGVVAVGESVCGWRWDRWPDPREMEVRKG